MKSSKQDFSKQISNRLTRCEGHLRAIRRMVGEGKSCESLFVQLAAVRSAVGEVSMKIYERHLDLCLKNGGGAKENAELKFISKLMLSGKVTR